MSYRVHLVLLYITDKTTKCNIKHCYYVTQSYNMPAFPQMPHITMHNMAHRIHTAAECSTSVTCFYLMLTCLLLLLLILFALLFFFSLGRIQVFILTTLELKIFQPQPPESQDFRHELILCSANCGPTCPQTHDLLCLILFSIFVFLYVSSQPDYEHSQNFEITLLKLRKVKTFTVH